MKLIKLDLDEHNDKKFIYLNPEQIVSIKKKGETSSLIKTSNSKIKVARPMQDVLVDLDHDFSTQN